MRDVNQEFLNPALGETHRLRGRNRLRAGALAGALFGCFVGVLGCGYRPVYGGAAPVKYEVVKGRVATASFEAADAAAEGVRSELGAAAALGKGFPQVVVEIVRIDERSIGVRSMSNTPLARGSEIVVVGRALVLERADAPPSRDTGDMSRAAQFASGTTPSADAAARSRAVRDAALSLGKALGRVVLGLPEPAEG
jgi:hypothetical protein